MSLGLNVSLFFWVVSTVAGLLTAVEATAAPVCTPPIPPFLPENDQTFMEYADLLNEAFELYFSEMSSYSTCLNQAHADLLTEAHAVSALHSQFLARAEALGVARKAATLPASPPTNPAQDNRIEQSRP